MSRRASHPLQKIADKSGIILEGTLQKQGGMIKSWKKRFFKLKSNGTLSYFSHPSDLTPKGCIHLYGCRVERADDDRVSQDRGRTAPLFTLQSSQFSRVFLIQAASEEERTEWMEKITLVVQYTPKKCDLNLMEEALS